MKMWEIAPPAPPVHITKIVKLDFTVLPAIMAAAHGVGTLVLDTAGFPTAHVPSIGTVSLSEAHPFIVYLSDGKVARASGPRLRAALRATHQVWPGWPGGPGVRQPEPGPDQGAG